MGNASILFKLTILYKIYIEVLKMIKLNIVELLQQNNKSKYWLCQKMNITSRNLNRIIRGETTSISFKYIEEFCFYLNCTPQDLIKIVKEKKEDN